MQVLSVQKLARNRVNGGFETMTTEASNTVTRSNIFLAKRQIYLKQGVKETTTATAGKTQLEK